MMWFIFIIVPTSQQRKFYRFLFLFSFFLGWLGTCLSTLLIRGRCSYLSFLFKRLYSPDDELSRIIPCALWRVSPNVEEIVPQVVQVKSPPQEGTVADVLGRESVRRSFEASSSKLATFSLTSLSIFFNVEPNGRDKIVKQTWRIFGNAGKNTGRARPRKFKRNFEKSLNEILKKFK